MSDIAPVVRLMLLCDDVSPDPANPHKLNILGLMHAIRLGPGETFPFLLRQLAVYLLLAGGRGDGVVSVSGVVTDDEEEVFHTRPRAVNFGQDPLLAQGLIFRVKDVLFVRGGLYSIRFLCGDQVLAQQSILVR